jgi:HECT-domain (ubiquitin-transferase)/Hom_end-associated Hint/Leucine rich repeat
MITMNRLGSYYSSTATRPTSTSTTTVHFNRPTFGSYTGSTSAGSDDDDIRRLNSRRHVRNAIRKFVDPRAASSSSASSSFTRSEEFETLLSSFRGGTPRSSAGSSSTPNLSASVSVKQNVQSYHEAIARSERAASAAAAAVVDARVPPGAFRLAMGRIEQQRQSEQQEQQRLLQRREQQRQQPQGGSPAVEPHDGEGCTYCGCRNFKANFFNPIFCSFCFHIHPPPPGTLPRQSPRRGTTPQPSPQRAAHPIDLASSSSADDLDDSDSAMPAPAATSNESSSSSVSSPPVPSSPSSSSAAAAISSPSPSPLDADLLALGVGGGGGGPLPLLSLGAVAGGVDVATSASAANDSMMDSIGGGGDVAEASVGLIAATTPGKVASATTAAATSPGAVPRRVKIFETASDQLPNFSIERAKDQTDVVNMTTAFLVQAKEKVTRRNVTHGGERIRGTLRGPNAINIAPVVLDNADGSYLIMFSTAVSGRYRLKLYAKDAQTGVSHKIAEPIELHFMPGETASERCVAVGKGIWGMCTQNMPESFSIIPRDRFGNRRIALDDDFLVLFSPHGELEHAVYQHSLPSISKVGDQLDDYQDQGQAEEHNVEEEEEDEFANVEELESMLLERGDDVDENLDVPRLTVSLPARIGQDDLALMLPAPLDEDTVQTMSVISPTTSDRRKITVGHHFVTYDEGECKVRYTFYETGIYYIHIVCLATKDPQRRSRPIPGSPFMVRCVKEIVSEMFMPHEVAEFRRTGTLDRRGSGLTRFPMEVLQLHRLERLYLADNELRVVPVGLCTLAELIEVDLSRNRLKYLPPELGELHRLEELHVARNKLTSLPPEVGNLSRLRVLNVASNQIAELPSTVLRLRSLEELYLSGNPLTSPRLEVCALGIKAIFEYFDNLAPSVNAPFDVKMRWLRTQLRRFSIKNQGHVAIGIRDRATLLDESLEQLGQLSAQDMRKPLRVFFFGEEAVDLGGPRREWFRSFCRQMVAEQLGMFESFDDGRTFQPHPLSGQLHASDHLLRFRIFGRVIAQAIREQSLVDCHFTRSLYNALLRRQWQSELNSIDEFQLVNPSLYASMIKPLLMNDVDVTPGFGDIMFSWEAIWRRDTSIRQTFTLGKYEPTTLVTQDNKWSFAQLFCRSRMYISIREQLEAFIEGFYEVVPPELITCFKPRELENLICGFSRVDVHDLQANTFVDVANDHPNPHHIVQWYWEAICSFSQLDLSKLMQFVTGSSQVPVGGFAKLAPMFTVEFCCPPDSSFEDDRLPTSSTCLRPDTRVMMHSGTIRPISEVRVGDELMGDDLGGARRVERVIAGAGPMYRVSYGADGAQFECNGPHLLVLEVNFERAMTRNALGQLCARYARFERDAELGFDVPRQRCKRFSAGAAAAANAFLSEHPARPLWQPSAEQFCEYARRYPKCAALCWQKRVAVSIAEAARPVRTLTQLVAAESDVAPSDLAWLVGAWLGSKLEQPGNGDRAIRGHLAELVARVNTSQLGNMATLSDEAILSVLCDTEKVRAGVIAGLIDSVGTLERDDATHWAWHLDLHRSRIVALAQRAALSLGYHSSMSRTSMAVRILLPAGDGDIVSDAIVCARKRAPPDAGDNRCARGEQRYRVRVTPIDDGDYIGVTVSGANQRFLLDDCTVVHNCFNTLRIPNYSSCDQITNRLRYAIHGAEGYFGQC